jgi:protein-disulfide isomerase
MLSAAAVFVAASLLWRELFSLPADPQSEAFAQARLQVRAESAVFTPSWRNALQFGIPVGDTGAPVKIVVLSDLECPFCAAFERTMQALLRRRPNDVEMVFVHFPLPMHPFAAAAARAADCAVRFGRFREFIDLVYKKQDSLGVKSWGAYAREADIRDTAAIVRCAQATSDVPRVVAGRSFARSIGALATPTVIVNGWTFRRGAPPLEVLDKLVDSIAVGSRKHGQVTSP